MATRDERLEALSNSNLLEPNMTEAATTAHALPLDVAEVAPERDLMSKFDGLIAEREALVRSGVRNPFTIVMDEVKSPTEAVIRG